MKILIINASHRAGNTDIIINKVKNQLSTHNVNEIKLRAIEMKLPDGCSDCAEGEPCPNIKDQFAQEIEPSLRGYDTYILATPTWSDNVTPLALIFWNRIVTWYHEDNEYLKDKKLAIITHGMAGRDSWENVIRWVKSVCSWEQCLFAGSLICQSGAEVGEVELQDEEIKKFIKNL